MNTRDGDGGNEKMSLVTLADYEAVETVEQALSLENRVLVQLGRKTECDDRSTCERANGRPWPWTHVLALDVGYARHCNATVAAGVLYDVATSSVVASRTQRAVSRFAYRPGLLAFREVPVLARVAEALLSSPSSPRSACRDSVLLLCDGHGTLHPQRCGVACHLGMLLDRPSVGVGKSYFVGDVTPAAAASNTPSPTTSKAHTVARLCAQLDQQRGARLALYLDNDGDEHVAGYILRTQNAVRPLFISAGHRITQDDACDAVLQLCHTYRQPEPIRHADHLGRVEVRNIEHQSTIAIADDA